MANSYKLSFSGQEIDEKLGNVENHEERITELETSEIIEVTSVPVGNTSVASLTAGEIYKLYQDKKAVRFEEFHLVDCSKDLATFTKVTIQSNGYIDLIVRLVKVDGSYSNGTYHLARQSSLDNKIDIPSTTYTYTNSKYLLGYRLNGDGNYNYQKPILVELHDAKEAFPRSIPQYDEHGCLYAKEYVDQADSYQTSKVLTQNGLWDQINGVAFAWNGWAYYDEEGNLKIDDDFDEVASFIYDSYRLSMLHIESDNSYKQIVGAEIYWNEDGDDYIIFGKQYVWYKGTDTLEEL